MIYTMETSRIGNVLWLIVAVRLICSLLSTRKVWIDNTTEI
jgi:hypothetical protein